MKKILSLIIFIFFYFSNCLAINLPNDVSSGNNYFKSMDEFGQFKDYGAEIVSKLDGYPVRSGQKSLRFEIRGGDCQKNSKGWNDCELKEKDTSFMEKNYLEKVNGGMLGQFFFREISRKLHQLEYIWANFTQKIRNMAMKEIHPGCFLTPQEKI